MVVQVKIATPGPTQKTELKGTNFLPRLLLTLWTVCPDYRIILLSLSYYVTSMKHFVCNGIFSLPNNGEVNMTTLSSWEKLPFTMWTSKQLFGSVDVVFCGPQSVFGQVVRFIVYVRRSD